jgi:hypothetical protein
VEDIHGAATAAPIADPPPLQGVPGGPGGDRGHADDDGIPAANHQAAPGLPGTGDDLGEEIVAVASPAAEGVTGGQSDGRQGGLELLMGGSQGCCGHGGDLVV